MVGSIESGQPADADEVMDALGLNFKNTANLLWNATLLGYDADLVASFLNLQQDDLDDNSQIDTTNSDIDDTPVFPAAVMDNHDDSSIDATIWTIVNTASENTQDIIVSSSGIQTSTAIADGASSLDLNSDGLVFFVKFRSFSLNASGAGGDSVASISIIDGSGNSVIINEQRISSGNASGTPGTFRININTTGNTLGKGTDITSTGDTGTDISSLVDGDVWHLRILASSSFGGTTASASISFERFIDGVAESDNFISSTTTALGTITNAILVVSDDTGAGSIAYTLSADNGANYESVTPNQIHRFTNTGTQLKMKAAMVSTTTDMPILWHHATTYNYY
ncbi:MAG: hypothetical protein KJI69_05730 [Patescibacteria group bacterium]|nr:hypothetical protein [Patescibacteria group bacterium]